MEKKNWITPEIKEIDLDQTQGGFGTTFTTENPTYHS